MRVAINGFGRIGRTLFKTLVSSRDWGRIRVNPRLERGHFEVVALNNKGGLDEETAYLLKYDSVYGTYPEEVSIGEDGAYLVVGGQKYPYFDETDPAKLPWDDFDVDVVFECTGVFTHFQKAAAHLEAGAKRVVISANAKGEGPTLVLGTDSMEQAKKMADDELAVVSCGSCTTNAAAPVIQLLHRELEVLKAQMATVHAVTSTQSIIDTVNKNKRRSRAAYASIIPQPTGAAVAVTRVVPDLKGRISGSAFRVPVICGSVVEIVAQVAQETDAEKVNDIFREAADGEYQGIVEANDDELVSSDVIGRDVSSIVDLPLTEVLDLPEVKDENLVKVIVWYDNEYGYTCRLAELAQELFSR